MTHPVAEVSLQELQRRRVLRLARPEGEALIALIDGEVKAYSGVCPHLGGPLLEGPLRDDIVTCPWHSYDWDLRSGRCLTRPGRNWEGVAGYQRPSAPYSGRLLPLAVEVAGDTVRVRLHEVSAARRSSAAAGAPA